MRELNFSPEERKLRRDIIACLQLPERMVCFFSQETECKGLVSGGGGEVWISHQEEFFGEECDEALGDGLPKEVTESPSMEVLEMYGCDTRGHG